MKLLLVLALVGTSSCAHFNAQNVDRAQQAAQVACIIAHAAMPDERSVQLACNLGADMLEVIRRVVGEHRAGVRRELEKAGVKQIGYPAPWPTDDGGAP